jgi:hypothetical protein
MGRYLDLANLAHEGHQASSVGDSRRAHIATPGTTTTVSSSPLTDPEVIHVSYQRIFYDWELPDGTYTPEQLRKANLGVKPWGPVQSYTLTGTRVGSRGSSPSVC